jgi:GTP pyrophosphokinase
VGAATGGIWPTALAAAADDGVTAPPATAAPRVFLPEPPAAASVDISRLLASIRAYDPKADTSVVEAAFAAAAAAHEGQKRDNGDPYITHPIAVAEILAGYRLDVGSVATALLHDVIEDTGVSREKLERRFGAEIAGLVDGVTKLTRLELHSDRTKQAENFRKLVLAMSRDIRVLLVKLADRLHNMRTIGFVAEPARRQRIARETMDIYAPLAERIGMDTMKKELQTLAFAVLEPENFETIQARLNFLSGQGADVIEEVRKELTNICKEQGITQVEVTGREKSPYSVWEKMQRRNVQFDQLSDIMAFRIVVPTREDCYLALGAVHAAYQVVAGRFKDYISSPKANGYQSLHTGVTLREPRNQKIEVQIRTREMHEVAENGVAAHWIYKQHDGTAAEAQNFRWVQDLLEILENSTPDEFLENTRLELYQDRVFCFTPKGRLIQLPRHATPIDFAYAVHSQIGDTCVGAKINGRLMPLRHELQNGDQVEIMTARGGNPSPQWERFVVTGKARARIRRYIQQQQRQQHRDAGKSALAKQFRQEGLDGSEKILEGLLKQLKIASLEDLYVAVGKGDLSAHEVVFTAYPDLRQAAHVPRLLPTLPARPPRAEGGKQMAIKGLPAGMAVSYAGCCHPLPGDRIVGIVATGKGVTIHTRDCPMLESLAATPERFLDVDWEQSAFTGDVRNKGEGHTGRLSVIASNEPTALAEITNAVTKQKAAVAALRVTGRQNDFFEALIDIEVNDLGHLGRVIAGLRGTSVVHQVDRAKG